MRTSDELFQLIKSLTKSEKRYFKLFASLYGGEKNYLRLFDAIDQQRTYDEARIREAFSNERFVRQLNVVKGYLYDQIMRSLRVYHAGTDIRAEIRDLIQNIEILFEKGLVDQARKVYETAKALATEHEDFHSLFEILNWSERLDPSATRSEEGIDRVFNPIYTEIDRFRNYLDYAVALRKIALPVLDDQPRSAEELDAMDRALQRLPGDDGSPLTVKAAYVQCWSMATYHFGRREYQEALEQTDHHIALMEEHPALIAANPFNYLAASNNRLVLLKRTENFVEFWNAVEEIRTKTQALVATNRLWSPRVRGAVFGTIYINLLTIYIGGNEKSRYHDLVREIEMGMAEHGPYLNPNYKRKFDQNLALLYFDLGDYRRALDYNLALLDGDYPDGHNADIYHARLMNLAIHYELGNTDLLEYLIPSACRYFRSRKSQYRFESAVLDFFKRLIRLNGNRSDQLALFEETHARFAKLLEDPLEADAFRSFQYYDWIGEKIAALRPTPVAAYGRASVAAI